MKNIIDRLEIKRIKDKIKQNKTKKLFLKVILFTFILMIIVYIIGNINPLNL